jgi:hypothetical protein
MREGKASSSVTLVEFEKIKLAIDFPYQVELTAIFCIYLLPSAPYEETDRRMIEQVVRHPKKSAKYTTHRPTLDSRMGSYDSN